jgi:hypothetical protein
MSEYRGMGHRDRDAHEYTVERELARRRARGCVTALYVALGVVVGIGLLVTCAIIGSFA